MESLTKFLKWLERIPLSLLLSLTLCAGAILLAPDFLAKRLYLEEFRERFGPFLGPAILLLVFMVLARVFEFIRVRLVWRKNEHLLQSYLHELTPEEKGYLAPFILEKKNTINVDIQDGIMNGLQAKRIVGRSSRVGNMIDGFPYNLQPWARRYLSEHPKLLDGAVGFPMTPRQKRGAGRRL